MDLRASGMFQDINKVVFSYPPTFSRAGVKEVVLVPFANYHMVC